LRAPLGRAPVAQNSRISAGVFSEDFVNALLGRVTAPDEFGKGHRRL